MKTLHILLFLLISITLNATTYHFANSGNDISGNGSAATPFASLAKANSLTLVAGDSVLFKRGDSYRGALIVPASGNSTTNIIYGAYGTGNKPKILGSRDISNTSDWVLSSGNIWVTAVSPMSYTSIYPIVYDMANLYFNNEASYGWFKMDLPSCTSQGDFYVNQIDHKVYMYSVGNPGSFYTHIEAAGVFSESLISISHKDYITLDNLDIRYAANNGVFLYYANNCIVQNCDLSWIGGMHFDAIGGRMGNALQMWQANSNHIFRYNYVHDIYDTGISPQGDGSVTPYVQSNIQIYKNLFVNFWFAYEVFDTNGGTLTNVTFDNNTCVNAGGTWSAPQRPFKTNERHVMWWNSTGIATGCYMRNNIFYGITDNNQALRFDTKVQCTMSNNLYYGITNIARLGYPTPITYSTLLQWQTVSSQDANSISADPLFISTADYHLQSDSPAKNAGIDIGLPYSESAPEIGAYEYLSESATKNINNNGNTIMNAGKIITK
jgi:hypothetical protein